MHIELNTTVVRNANGSLSHTCVSLNDDPDPAMGTIVGHCPGVENLDLWIKRALAEYPGPAMGWNTHRVVHTRTLTRAAE